MQKKLGELINKKTNELFIEADYLYKYDNGQLLQFYYNVIVSRTVSGKYVVSYEKLTSKNATSKSEKMTTMPVANVSNALGGRVSGLVTQQATGEPGNDASTLYLRGNKNPLVLVDGIESEYNMINMEEVESVTLLKDASAVAPYGLKGANGVVLILSLIHI